MEIGIIILSLTFLIYMAYKGHSVIIFAPIAALLAVWLTEPAAVAPAYSGLFLDKMVVFVKSFFPVFLLGALFGKVIELSGNAKSISAGIMKVFGAERVMLVIVLSCAILTYGGVSLNVVVFAVYPFAAEMFRRGNIPKRLIPGAIALGAFTFTMDSLPGSPQIQNIIPTTFFGTTTWAAPWLGTIGGTIIFISGMLYLESCRKNALKLGEGYGTNHSNEPATLAEDEKLPSAWIAFLPLLLVCIGNYVFTKSIPGWYVSNEFALNLTGTGKAIMINIKANSAIWGVEAALILGIITVFVTRWKAVSSTFMSGSQKAVQGALLAAMNSASEFGFGAVIAALPGFVVAADLLHKIPDPLFNEAISITVLAGLTGSAIAGLSVSLGAMSQIFIDAAAQSGIPLEVFHRIASMASGGMDTLPHNGAVITLLTVTGLTHKESYKNIFAITIIKTLVAMLTIMIFYTTGII